MPSHFSGIFGLKPTYGRVPNWPVPNNDQVSHVGPMTRTVGDSALMLQAMAGPHQWDHTSLEAPPAAYPARLDDGIADLKVAFSPDLGHARVDSDVAALVQSAAEAFQSLGCTVESPALPFGPEGPEIIRLLWPIHLHAYRPLLDEFEERMDPGLVACIRAADGVTGATYLETRARKLAYVEAVHRFFEEWDLLLTPAVSVAAFPAERLQPEHWPSHPWDWIMWAEFSYPSTSARTRRLGALRLYRCGSPGRAADRGPPLRRSHSAPGRPRLRAGAPVGGPAARALAGGRRWASARKAITALLAGSRRLGL